MNHVDVKLTEGAEETAEILAAHITAISEGVQKLLASPLKRDTIVLLIQNAISGPIKKSDIHKVLDAIPLLKDLYLKKPLAGQK